jgi:hypothetical protein
VAGVKCARHAIVERVCDLHFGERYVQALMSCNVRTDNLLDTYTSIGLS